MNFSEAHRRVPNKAVEQPKSAPEETFTQTKFDDLPDTFQAIDDDVPF